MNAPIDNDKDAPPMATPPWMRPRSPTPAMPRTSNIEWPSSSKSTNTSDDRASRLRPLRSLEPEIVPEPRNLVRPEKRTRPLLQASLYLWLAAIVCYGVVEMTLAGGQRPPLLALDANVGPAASLGGDTTKTAARLVVDDRQAVANEPLTLGIALNDATGAEAVVLTGLAEGTKLSAGAPMGTSGWRVPVRDIANVVAYPPASFVGVVDVLVELQSADAAPIDMQVARFEWTAKPNEARAARAATMVRNAAPVARDAPVLPKTPLAASTAKLAPDRVAWLVKRGLDFLKDGNFAATRLMLRPAADAGDAQAALLMGATYDPVVLAELGSVGLRPDPAAARA